MKKGEYYFIRENSHKQKIITLIVSLFVLAVLLALSFFVLTHWYGFVQKVPIAEKLVLSIKEDIINVNLKGLFYAHLIGGLFFVPSPDEIVFYYSLTKGNPFFLAIVFSLIGHLIAQLLNYFVGLKVSPFILSIISKKEVYKARRFVNRYGGYGIFIFNFVPLPAPLLTFALGIAKYNFTRLFLITIIAKVCEYSLIVLIFTLLSA